jgi:TPP-dependent 2-oxoacid decarboxylase
MSESVIEYVLRRLHDIGIDAIFGVAWDFAFPIHDVIVNDRTSTGSAAATNSTPATRPTAMRGFAVSAR